MAKTQDNPDDLSISLVHKTIIVEDCENQANYTETFIELKREGKVISSVKINPRDLEIENDDGA
jgi:hypothetical protein